MEWYAATRRLVGFTVAYAVLVAGAIVLGLTLADVPRALQARAVVIFGLVLGFIAFAVVIGLVISLAFWIYAAVRQTAEHGAPSYGHLGFWGAGAFLVLFLLGFVMPSIVVSGGLRLVGCALLIAGVVHTRAWLRERTAPGRPYAADRYDLVTGGDASSPVAAQPTADDWNASMWDPDVQRDIERRRHRGDPAR